MYLKNDLYIDVSYWPMARKVKLEGKVREFQKGLAWDALMMPMMGDKLGHVKKM